MTNIALVVLDTLREDRFRSYFQQRLPGTTFENAYSTSHWTVPACASLLTGQYASEVGITQSSTSVPPDVRTLPEAMKDVGYSTRMLTANPNLHVWDGWEDGFDEVFAEGNIPPRADNAVDLQRLKDEHGDKGLEAYSSIVTACLRSDHPLNSLIHGFTEYRRSPADGYADSIYERLKTVDFNSENEFLFCNIMNSHSPYRTADGNVVDAKTGDGFAGTIEFPDRIIDAYDYEAKRLAEAYESIHQLLRKNFDIIITLADHGECLGEYEMWNHGYGVFPELAQIPVHIWGDEIVNKQNPISILDVHQTIASEAGADVESRGVDLTSEMPELDRLVEYHGLLGWHYDQFRDMGVSEDEIAAHDSPLYGIVTTDGAYAYQTKEGWVSDEDMINYEERLRSIQDSITTRDRDSNHEDMTDSIKQRLEDLGYA